MGKKKTAEEVQQTQQEQAQPTFLDELLKNGTATLTAKTREELAKMVDEIPVDCSYGAGAACRDVESGLVTLRIDLIKK